MRNVTIWSRDGEFLRLFEFKGRLNTLNNFLYPAYIYSDGAFRLRSDGEATFLGDETQIEKGYTVLMKYEGEEDKNGTPFMVHTSFSQAINFLVLAGWEFYGDEARDAQRRSTGAIDIDARQKEYFAIARDHQQSALGKAVVDIKQNHPDRVVTEEQFRNGGADPKVDELTFPKHPLSIVPACVPVAEDKVGITPVDPSTSGLNLDLSNVSTKVGNNQEDYATVEIKHDSSIPVPPSKVLEVEKPRKKKASFMENMMKFLRLFRN